MRELRLAGYGMRHVPGGMRDSHGPRMTSLARWDNIVGGISSNWFSNQFFQILTLTVRNYRAYVLATVPLISYSGRCFPVLPSIHPSQLPPYNSPVSFVSIITLFIRLNLCFKNTETLFIINSNDFSFASQVLRKRCGEICFLHPYRDSNCRLSTL